MPVLEETWTVRAYDVEDPLLVDFLSDQRCVATEPLVINEYHYGGLGLRGARDVVPAGRKRFYDQRR